MPPKKFEIFKTEAEIKEGEKDYRNRILRIANGGIIEARIAEISKTLHNELHSKKNIDTKGEMEKYRNAREDVCLSFGVPEDGDHVSIEPERSGMQRSYRAFAVFVDRAKENKETGLHEAFYSEGRTAHHQLLERIMELMKNYGIEDVDMEAYSNDSEKFLLISSWKILRRIPIPKMDRAGSSLRDFCWRTKKNSIICRIR